MELNKYNHVGGFHCVATGMGWFPISVERILYQQSTRNKKDLIKEIENISKKLDSKKEEYNKMANYCPNLYEYLKENIHDN